MVGGGSVLPVNLITDRTQADVSANTNKGYYNFTDLNRVSEAQEYLKTVFDNLPEELRIYLQKAINSILTTLEYEREYYDLDNPILPDDLAKTDYTTPIAMSSVKTDWENIDYPFSYTDESRNIYNISYYLTNVDILRSVLTLPAIVPETPKTLNGLDFIGANAIEEILVAINKAYETYSTDKKAAIDEAEKKAKEKYHLMADSWLYSDEVYAGEV